MMDFDKHEDQEEEEEEEEEEEMGRIEAEGYDSFGNSSFRTKSGGGGDGAASTPTPRKKGGVRYKECLKNHAVSIGGHAVDGCGEFMAAGDEGTLDALKCAACNCHRNFHRKETEGESSYYLQHDHHDHHPQQQHQIQFYRAPPPDVYLHLTPTPQPLALPANSGGGGYSRQEEDVSNPSCSGGGGGGRSSSGSKKRFRTKFTEEQKEKMLAFAERVGWRIPSQDAGAVEQFCAETGVKRHVFKVWMHNNKHTLGKKP